MTVLFKYIHTKLLHRGGGGGMEANQANCSVKKLIEAKAFGSTNCV